MASFPARALRATLAAATLLLAQDADPQTCSTAAAARAATASSYLDTLLNGADKEDAAFFTKSGGIPNIFFLLDNSGSMVRLPPNGGGFYPGTYPPLADPSCPAGGDAKDPDCQYKSLKTFDADCADMTDCPIIGCGDDTESAKHAGDGTLIGWFRDRQFFPPCAQTLTPGLLGTKYGYDAAGTFVGGAAFDYAAQSSMCPYYTQGANAVAIPFDDDKAGFDPDFYCGSGGAKGPILSCGGQKANFFDKTPVFHDAVLNVETGAPADGWTSTSVNPFQKGSNVLAPAAFCAELYANTAFQGTERKLDICTSCLEKRGFFFDGRLFRASTAMDGLSNVGYPSLWLTGNWLNFYPPKFLVARKILKDVVMDKVKVRMGIARFGSTGAEHGDFMSLKPTCDMPDANWTSSRSTFMTAVDSYVFDKGTPMARALLDIGQYYHTPELDWFGYGDTWDAGSNTQQQSVCYSCQTSTIVLISDGVPKATDGNVLPAGTVTAAQATADYAGNTAHGIKATVSSAGERTGGIPTSLCSACETFPASEDWKNNPIRVAWYLHNLDLRGNTEATADCREMNGKQTLDTYTVGFATSALPDADNLLRNVAAMGGGEYVSAENPAALRAGLEQILTTINDRSTSFSVATVSTLQTTSGHSVIVPRFDPAKPTERLWRGHLFRYELYSEFLNACEETSDGTGLGDLDCDGKCLSVFLQDADGDFIQEDDSGVFRKNQPGDAAPCSQASACVGKGSKTCAVAGTPPATPHWDTQVAMKAQHWRTGRRVYSVVDDSGPTAGTPDGKIDRHDTVFRLEATSAVAAKLAPYLRLGGAGSGDVCGSIANTLATRGDPDTAAVVRSDRTFCVKEIIRFVLGADVFNDNGARLDSGVWPKDPSDAGQDTLPDRDIQLGDIFHSAPVVVDPPLPADGVLCPNGLHGQCLPSLWRTPTPGLPANTNPYDVYAKSSAYKNRRKIIIVGANDGLLRAIDGGTWNGNPNTDGSHNDAADDPLTEGLDESLPPFNGYYTRGTGKEVWAFLPPDLIAKIPLLVTGHQLFVDGSPMIRDVWVDGTTNALSSSATLDGKKQSHEFHTVAVVGERRGGTHYFALDITDATDMPDATNPAKPKFLWLYPQTDDPETLSFGETYNDYLPSRAPIGPVRIKSDATSNALFGTSTAAGTMPVTGVTGGVPYHERWVTFLAGGFDPQGVRGRGVHMVDVWTGRELFDFSRPTTGCTADSTDPRCQLKAPIAATVAMIMWGSAESANSSFGNDGFFDTATFGDTAGQLWTLRFSDPGTLDSTTKKVKDWYGGRAFAMEGCAHQPFFHITANAQVPGGWLRTYAGTGDRYNLLDTFGGQCGPDNLRACAARGCSVTVTSGDANSLACTDLGRESGGAALTSCSASTPSWTSSRSYASTLTGCVLEGKAKVVIDCSGTNDTTKDVQVSCADSTNGLLCGHVANAPGAVLDLGDATDPIEIDNWYFSIRVFDTADRPIFRTEDEAEDYDANRLTVTDTATASTGIVLIDGSVDEPTALADRNAPGWAMFFNHDGVQTVSDHEFTVSRYDERVSSTSALYGLLSWNTVQPVVGTVARATSSATKCQVAKCAAENRRLAYHYVADPVTGGSVLRDADGNLVRSVASTALVPSMGDQPTVFVNQQGQVQVALTAVNPERGASTVTTGVMRDPTPSFGVIPVSKDTHACRHATAAPDEAVCK